MVMPNCDGNSKTEGRMVIARKTYIYSAKKWLFLLQVTKAALIITGIFIVTFSYNLWYFLLGTIGLFEFRAFNFHQGLSQWATSFNCFINPFVYIIVMPSFQRSVVKTFCFCCKKDSTSQENLSFESVSSTSVNNVSRM